MEPLPAALSAAPAAPPTADGGRRPGLTTFAALRHRNYRLWFTGQIVSLFGSWMQTTAQAFLVFELTRSPAYLGYVAFAASAPAWVFMLGAGVIADRVPRRRLMLVTQSAMMVLAAVLAALTLSGVVRPWQIMVLACAQGVANAFDAPARQALVTELVERADLTNAIALNSTMFNAAVTLGPAISGVVYAAVGPGWCFVVNALSFLGTIIALSLLRLPAPVARPSSGAGSGGLLEGLSFVAHDRVVRVLVGLVMAISVFGLGYVTLFPAWASEVLGGGATTNGLLQSARGLGALIGALAIASLGRSISRGALLTVGTFLFPTLALAFAGARWLPWSLLALVGAGFGLILIFNLANALVQEHVPDALRGRVMAVYTLAVFGFLPIGSLLAGELAERIGVVEALLVTASATLLCAVVAAVRFPWLRRL